MARPSKESDPTKDPKFQGVVDHFLKTPPQPRTQKPRTKKEDHASHASMTLRLRIYEFIATPVHAWLWLCARFVGGDFKCGPVADPSESLE